MQSASESSKVSSSEEWTGRLGSCGRRGSNQHSRHEHGGQTVVQPEDREIPRQPRRCSRVTELGTLGRPVRGRLIILQLGYLGLDVAHLLPEGGNHFDSLGRSPILDGGGAARHGVGRGGGRSRSELR
jgi:hypothetical protein